MKTLKLGTRTSPLALKQAQIAIDALQAIDPAVKIEIVGVSTKGDRLKSASLTKIGGKGVFVKEIERQLLAGTIDFAVHSLKDVPAEIPAELTIAAMPPRADPFDCLVLAPGADLQAPLVIGTSSIRRQKQLAAAYPKFSFVPIRGNIETRLRKISSESLGGTILAAAGIERMGYLTNLENAHLLPPEICVPAVGQGILAVECRNEDAALCRLLAQIDDPLTAEAGRAERFFLAAMNGNCELPIGAFARKERADQWAFSAFLAKDRVSRGKTLHLCGADPLKLAEEAKEQLL